jgi:hypothetical protein
MALTSAKNTLKEPESVKTSCHIRIILALALSGLAELASLFLFSHCCPLWPWNMMSLSVR